MSAKSVDLKNSILIFSDGACSGNPGPGGWACIIVVGKKVVELGGHSEHTTNNKMELTAVGKALRYLENISGDVHVFTDSKYVIEGITRWARGWAKRNWKKADNKPVANAKYWERLLELVEARKNWGIDFHHVRGHSGVPGNERCDEVAVRFAKKKHVDLYEGPLESYPVKLL